MDHVCLKAVRIQPANLSCLKAGGMEAIALYFPPHIPDTEEQKEQGPMETHLKTDMPLKFAA